MALQSHEKCSFVLLQVAYINGIITVNFPKVWFYNKCLFHVDMHFTFYKVFSFSYDLNNIELFDIGPGYIPPIIIDPHLLANTNLLR